MPLIKPEDLYTSSGQRRTRALFKETCSAQDTPVAALGKRTDGLIPMRDLFIEFCVYDPSEAEFAELVFGDYSHWALIKDTPWIAPYLDEWRMITDVKRKSIAFKSILKEAQEGRSPLAAAKYLIEEGWKDKRNTKTRKQNRESTEKAVDSVSSDIARLKDYM